MQECTSYVKVLNCSKGAEDAIPQGLCNVVPDGSETCRHIFLRSWERSSS